MTQDLLETRIEELITPSINSMDYNIVRIKINEGGGVKTLQIMAERKSDGDLGVKDCTKISRTVSAIMDVEDPITDEYSLEVSSPGIDRPLVKKQDFIRFADNEAKIITNFPINGRKRYRGKLLGVNDSEEVIIKMDDCEENSLIPFEEIASAKLVITDELINKLTNKL